MKVHILFVAILTLLGFSCDTSTSKKQAEFYVRGNCGMCEERIETTVKDVDGVIWADWNVKTKMLSVTYDTLKTNEITMHKAVAGSGHETKLVESPKEVHDELPECCKKGSSM